MKKLLLVLAIGAFVACNDNTHETTESTNDTTTTSTSTIDTNTVSHSTMDTTKMPSDTTKKMDTTVAPKK